MTRSFQSKLSRFRTAATAATVVCLIVNVVVVQNLF